VRERQQELKRIIDNLKEERLRLFRDGFGVINSKLKEVYQHLTRGGDA
jgi:chromosome segregation ATPase